MNEVPGGGAVLACERSGVLTEALFMFDFGIEYKLSIRGVIQTDPRAVAVARTLLTPEMLLDDGGRMVIGDHLRAAAAAQIREAIEKGGSANGHKRPQGHQVPGDVDTA